MGFLVSAAILAFAMWIVASHDADISPLKVIIIAFGTAAVSMLASFIITSNGLPEILVLPIVLIFLAVVLIRFCYVSMIQAVIICGVWLLSQIIIGVILTMMFSARISG